MSETQTAVNAIEMHGIVMEFSGVRALDGVDFSLRQGQVMGLVGKNGAGRRQAPSDFLARTLINPFPSGNVSRPLP